MAAMFAKGMRANAFRMPVWFNGKTSGSQPEDRSSILRTGTNVSSGCKPGKCQGIRVPGWSSLGWPDTVQERSVLGVYLNGRELVFQTRYAGSTPVAPSLTMFHSSMKRNS